MLSKSGMKSPVYAALRRDLAGKHVFPGSGIILGLCSCFVLVVQKSNRAGAK
jgi:hypothetical protein